MTGKMDKGNGASLFVAPLLLALLVLMMAAGTGWAAEITVNDSGDGTGTCTLADAIRSANSNEDVGGCIGNELPYGNDTIILETDVNLESGHDERPPIIPYYETDTGTCPYSDTLTIEGQGHTIDGKGGDGYVLKVSRSPYEDLEEYECSKRGVLTVNNATITGGNHAYCSETMPGNGGGIVNAYEGDLTLNNVTVSGNQAAGSGGGIFSNPAGILILNNVTISDNTAEGDGGGVYVQWVSPKGKVTLNNSIISGNTVTGTASDGNELYIGSGFGDLTTAFNLFGHSGESADDAFGGSFEPGTSDVDATNDGTDTPLDSILDPTLADNGGSTLTHALVPGSPAIDLELGEACSSGLIEDQRGESRPFGDGCDAGAFEFSLGDIDGDGDVDSDDLALLAEAFGSVVGNPMYNAKADLDSDGDVDGHDLYLFTKHFVPVIAEILPQTVNEGELLSLDITASDPDNGTLHYPTENLNLPQGASLADNGDGTAVFSWTPTCSQSGDYPPIDIEVRDQGNLSDSEPLEISVLEDNIPPSVLTKDITVQLDASGHVSITAADIDDGSNDACGVTLSIDKSEFTSADIGENTVTLTATDSNGNSGTETATVTVESNSTSSITVDSDGNCTLHDAITAANTDAPSGGCPAGSGHDEIILETDVLLDVALPVIASTITIEGQEHIIDGNNGDWAVLTITEDGNLTLNEATVTGADHGEDTAIAQSGGGIRNYYGVITLNSSTISGNSAKGGGGLTNFNGTATLNNSTVSGNSASGHSGGIANGGTLTLINSTVSGNSASTYAGGIYNVDTTILTASVISGNTSSSEEGREFYNRLLEHGTDGVVTADSFNLFGYSGETSAEALFGFTPGINDVIATNDCDTSDNNCIPTALSAILSPLADNGGPTKTHALVPGSPALDLDTTCSTGLTTDQRGEPRPVGDGCDAGAFEGGISTGKNTSFLPAVYLLLNN